MSKDAQRLELGRYGEVEDRRAGRAHVDGGRQGMANTHSAAGPALGYQYQADYCLYALVKDAAPGRSISLELHDDVAWVEAGTAVEQLQVKHKVNAAGGLGNASDAMWRTLKAWMDAGNPGDPDGPSLFMVTTATAAPGSAAHALRPDSRDAATAAAALRATATDSDADGTAAARKLFKELSVPTQNAFVARIRVIDAQPNVLDIDQAIRDELWKHMPESAAQQDDFMSMLWGWWRTRAVEMLSRRYFPTLDLRDSVTAADLKSQLVRLTIACSDKGLPEYEDLDVDDTHDALAGMDSEVFVQQLDFLQFKVHTRVVRRAIVDYYRAVSSEVRWLERDFLRSDEVQRYERRLCEAWDVAFGLMVAQLGSNPSEEERVDAGRLLLSSSLSKQPLRIREMVDQDFYYRGKHHMLAQDGAVGWHPEFRERLDALLVSPGVTT